MSKGKPMGYRKRRRLIIVTTALISTGAIALLLIFALGGDNMSLYKQPTAVLEDMPAPGRALRLGGLVEHNSVRNLADGVTTSFRITDCRSSIDVVFTGLLPDLFRPGQGVITEGSMNEDGQFRATRVLAKHDETYMPKEAAPKYADQCSHPEGVDAKAAAQS